MERHRAAHVAEPAPTVSSEESVRHLVLKQAALAAAVAKPLRTARFAGHDAGAPDTAFDRCGAVCKEYAKKELGTARTRRTPPCWRWPDRWESRLEDVFAGRPYDMLDAALADAVAAFPAVNARPFRDMIEGMRMDLARSRYATFDDLYLYCYRVAGLGTPGPTSGRCTPVRSRSASPTSARRGRIYLPQDELAMAGISEADIFAGRVTDEWRSFMQGQIARARAYFRQAEQGAAELNQESRWPVWASLLLYRQILDEIEANDYDNFTKRAYVPKAKKLAALPKAYFKSLRPPPSQRHS
ncbi:hypothetical protein ACQ4PT_061751 [Festuca glaucescens]